MRQLTAPVQYYGGKSGMAKEIISLFPASGTYTTFVEVFGGGASVLLAKPREDGVVEVYNDLGENIWSLYKVIADNELYGQLKELLDKTLYSRQLHDEFLEKLANPNISLLERAFYYLYVNRTSFNGVAGFSKSKHVRRGMSKSVSCYLAAIERLPEIHDRLSSVIIEHADGMYVLDAYDDNKTFMYVDPPYVRSTRSTNNQYEVEMTDEQHVSLCQKLVSMDAKLLVSGYDHEIYRDILEPKFSRVETVSMLSASRTPEILWKNYE